MGWGAGTGERGGEESFSDPLCVQSIHSTVNLSHKQVLVETAARCQWQNSESSSTMAPMPLRPHNNYVEAIYSVFNTECSVMRTDTYLYTNHTKLTKSFLSLQINNKSEACIQAIQNAVEWSLT